VGSDKLPFSEHSRLFHNIRANKHCSKENPKKKHPELEEEKIQNSNVDRNLSKQYIIESAR